MAEQNSGTDEFTKGAKESEPPASSMRTRLRVLLVGQGVYDAPETDGLAAMLAYSGNDLRRERVRNAIQRRQVNLWSVMRCDQDHDVITAPPHDKAPSTMPSRLW